MRENLAMIQVTKTSQTFFLGDISGYGHGGMLITSWSLMSCTRSSLDI